MKRTKPRLETQDNKKSKVNVLAVKAKNKTKKKQRQTPNDKIPDRK